MSDSVEVSLFLVSTERIVRLQKTLTLAAFPRLREFLKVRNASMGDYIAYQVVPVTHREDAIPEIWIHATSLEEGRTLVSFFKDDEIDHWADGYVAEGWRFCSSKPNRTFKDNGTSIWSAVVRDDDAV
jgi:hypothetical protein